MIDTKYCILGAGIAGLLAAKAIEEAGEEFTMLDQNPGLTNMNGLHYLHDPCGLRLKKLTVYNLVLSDTNDPNPPYIQYANKIGVPEKNSVRETPLTTDAYDMRQAQERLYLRYKPRINKQVVDRKFVDDLLAHGTRIISTIPLPVLVPGGDYQTKKIYASDKRPLGLGLEHAKQNIVVYNTDCKYSWYRYSRINGCEWTEMLLGGDFVVTKVMGCNVKSFHENLILSGRYGTWQRGVLAHESYYQIKEALNNGF